MTPAFLSAIVDTLLPGDRGTPPLPTGTDAGVATKLQRLARVPGGALHSAVLQAIESASGGQEAFVRADADGRIACVRRVEREMPGPFKSLVALVLQDYYEAAVVLLAMGWRAEPPSPRVI